MQIFIRTKCKLFFFKFKALNMDFLLIFQGLFIFKGNMF